MFSEEEAEVLRVLLDDLRGAFRHQKARHVVKAAQKAYMRAAFNKNQIDRHRQKQARIAGSARAEASNDA